MGFETAAAIATAAAAAAAKTAQAIGEHEQSKAYRRAATVTEQNAKNRAESIADIAMENQRREQRNARLQLARARADAGASNLLTSGSTSMRELDLATRLEDEINSRTDAALEEATRTYQQGRLDAWNLRQQSRNAFNSMLGPLLESTSHYASTGMKAYNAYTDSGYSSGASNSSSGDGLR